MLGAENERTLLADDANVGGVKLDEEAVTDVVDNGAGDTFEVRPVGLMAPGSIEIVDEEDNRE